MVRGDPERDNDLILEALRDQDCGTENLVETRKVQHPDGKTVPQDMTQRARTSTSELSHGATLKAAR